MPVLAQALKPGREPSDPRDMGAGSLSCPICQADLLLEGDEKPGDEVICSYCGAPSLIAGDPDDPREWEAEEEEF